MTDQPRSCESKMVLTAEVIKQACDAHDPCWRHYNMSLWWPVQRSLAAVFGYQGSLIDCPYSSLS